MGHVRGILSRDERLNNKAVNGRKIGITLQVKKFYCVSSYQLYIGVSVRDIYSLCKLTLVIWHVANCLSYSFLGVCAQKLHLVALVIHFFSSLSFTMDTSGLSVL